MAILTDLLDDVPHCPRERCPHAEPSIVEDGHGHLEPVAHTAKHVLHWYWNILKVHLSRVGALKKNDYEWF